MKKSIQISLILSLFFIAGCTVLAPTKYSTQQKRITPGSASDDKYVQMIKPYKDALDVEMNVVLAVSDTILTKAVPESDLGNLMCDLILKKGREYCNCAVDFTFLNNGGIRIPNLPKGNITFGKIMELMPFDNQIAIMQVPGKTLDTLFNFMSAKGGWQISGARYTFKANKATSVYIQGDTLQAEKIYTIAVSDYLAQGGDNCTFFSVLPKNILQQNLRDAIVDGLKEMNARGERVKSVLDGRVVKQD